MPAYSLYQVDTFTTQPLSGNPCAVVFDITALHTDNDLQIFSDY